MSQKQNSIRAVLKRVQEKLELEGTKITSTRFIKVVELRVLAERLANDRRFLAIEERNTKEQKH